MRRSTVGAVLLLALALAGCESRELTRARAEGLLSQSNQLTAMQQTIRLQDAAQDKGVALDLWDSRWELTESGRGVFTEVKNGFGIPIQTVSPPRITVTGIAESPNLEGIKEIQFTAAYADLMRPVSWLAVRGAQGVASARLYDDGWRLEGVNLSFEGPPFPLSENDRKEYEAEVARVAQRRAERWAALERAFEESRRVTREVVRFESGLGTTTDFTQPVVSIAVTDVAVDVECAPHEWERTFGRKRSYWFGGIDSLEYQYLRENAPGGAHYYLRGWGLTPYGVRLHLKTGAYYLRDGQYRQTLRLDRRPWLYFPTEQDAREFLENGSAALREWSARHGEDVAEYLKVRELRRR